MALTLHHAPSRAVIPISVTGRSGIVTEDLQDFARRRLSFALRRFTSRLRHADVWLDDVNGPRGGFDKRCRIHLRLMPRGRVTVTAEASNEYAALARAAKRAAIHLDRRCKRKWMLRRRSSTS